MGESLFHLRETGADVRTELLAGATTFMVMAYIIFVNPAILSFAGIPALQGQGPPFAATVAATCLVAGVMTILMGLLSNYPLAMAPGMGLNAVVAFQLVAAMKLPWPSAMGVIFLEGLIITVLVLTGFRTAVMDAIPTSLKQAISVGIGLFLLFIGLVNGGFAKQGQGIPVTLGDLGTPQALVAIIGLFLTVGLMAWRVRGALLIGILLTTAFAILVNYVTGLKAFPTPGMAVIPSGIVALPDFSTFGRGLDFGVFARAGWIAGSMAVFSILLADFFDTMGTVIGIGSQAGWMDARGSLPRLRQVLLVDSLGALFGGLASSSSSTTYIESAAGVAAGGKTGLTSVFTGACFLLALFLSPLAGVVPPQATAAALIVVGFLMCAVVKDIPFADFDEGFPALVAITVMPFTYSITNGIGAGFVTYTFVKLVRGKGSDIHWMMSVVSLAFLIYFGHPWLRVVLSF